jgi:hypothetical protein
VKPATPTPSSLAGGGGRNNRIDSTDSRFRARTVISLDVRTQTEYGTVRAYNRFGFTASSTDTASGVLYTERAFIQIAGFTFGKTQSYFDFVGGAVCYGCGYGGHLSQYGAGGTLVAAYSATLGNGFTATLALEDQTQRRTAIWDASNDASNALAIGVFPGPAIQGPDAGTLGGQLVGDAAAHSVPDIVGSLRVDQAWGSAQISAAAHQLRGGWYGNNSTGAGANGTPFAAPSDTFGFAVDAGVIVNLPWAKGDRFYVEGAYSEGAPAYAGWSGGVQGGYAVLNRFSGRTVGTAYAFESIFGNLAATGPTGHQLTSSWTIGAGIEHYWTPAFRSSLLRQLQCDDVQRHGEDLVLRFAAEPDPHLGWCCSDRRRGVRGLQPRLQRVERGCALDLEPGAEPRCRPRGHVHQARAEPRSGARRTQLRGFGRSCGRPLCTGRPGRVQRPVPHPAQLLAMIA